MLFSPATAKTQLQRAQKVLHLRKRLFMKK